MTAGAITVNNTGSMTSATGQVLDFANLTATTPIAVTVQNSGTVQATGNDGLRFGGGAVSIANSGSILATGRAIELNSGTEVASFTLLNAQGGTIASNNDAVRINDGPRLGTVLVENRGTISSLVSGQAIDFTDARAASITIRNFGMLETADADGVRPGDRGVVENRGTIIGRSVAPGGSSDGIDFQDFSTGAVINSGTIDAARHGITGKQIVAITNETGGTILGRNGSGVNFDTLPEQGVMTVINAGTIIGQANPLAAYGDGDGVDIDGLGNIINTGSILGLGSIGTKAGDLQPATSEAIAIGGGTILNGTADVRTALISGIDNGILVDDSETGPAFAAIDITNYGRIEGLDGFGIRIISTDANTIENYGTIAGANGIAVEFGAGDDLFVRHEGSAVEGTVSGGAGEDTFRLAASGTASQFDVGQIGDGATYRAFETFDIAAGGTWTLVGTSTFAGQTVIAGSSVTLDGADLGSSAVSLTGSRLNGSGTVGSLAVAGSDVRLSQPNGAPAVLRANGDVSFDGNSSLAVNVNGTAGRLVSGGAVSVADGARLVVQGTSGCATAAPCTVISTRDGITGQFTVDNQLAFLNADLAYVGPDALLSLSRNGTSFAGIGETRNQRAVGGAFDAAGSGSALFDEVVGFTAADARGAFDQLSGDAFASQANATTWQELQFGDGLLARARGNLQAPATAATAPLGYAETRPVPEPFRTAAQANRAYGAWVRGTGGRLELDGDGNAGELDARFAGVVGGVDGVWDRFTLGVAGGYQNSRSEFSSRGTEIEADTGRIAVYGGAQFDAVRLAGGGSFAWSSFDSEREIAFGGVDETARGSFDGKSGSLFAEISTALALGGVDVEPFAAVTWTHVETDGFDERGAGITGLSVGEISESTTFTTLGVRVSRDFAWDDAVFTPSAGLAWRHAFDNDPVNVDMTFLATGTGFETQGLPLGEDSLLVNAGLAVDLGHGLALGVSYQGEFAEEGDSHTGRGTASFRF